MWGAESRRGAATLSLALFALAATASGGDWHSGATSYCTDCHTMHNSSGGQPMRYDNELAPAPYLLRDATALALCVYCHDGSLDNVPDVVAPVSYTADAAGGLFPERYTEATGQAHVLGGATPFVPPGGTKAMVLTCISCHDPHGGTNYRNLLARPLGTGPSIAVTAKARQKSSGANAAVVYTPTNVIYKAGMSAWCGACHGAFHGQSPNAEGTASPWLRHPQDRALSQSRHVDYTYWLGAVSNRVPVESPADDVVPSADDQVFCLSCHKAHGSANPSALIYADGSRLGSTCEECHNK